MLQEGPIDPKILHSSWISGIQWNIRPLNLSNQSIDGTALLLALEPFEKLSE